MTLTDCPICEATLVDPTTDFDSDTFRIVCTNCGSYCVTLEFVTSHELTAEERAILSMHLVKTTNKQDRHEVVLRLDTYRRIVNDARRSAASWRPL